MLELQQYVCECGAILNHHFAPVCRRSYTNLLDKRAPESTHAVESACPGNVFQCIFWMAVNKRHTSQLYAFLVDVVVECCMEDFCEISGKISSVGMQETHQCRSRKVGIQIQLFLFYYPFKLSCKRIILGRFPSIGHEFSSIEALITNNCCKQLTFFDSLTMLIQSDSVRA